MAQQGISTLQLLVGLSTKLQSMSERDLSLYLVSCAEFTLSAGDSNPYDPDADPYDVDDPESDFPCFNEWEGNRLWNEAKLEMERRAIEKRFH